MNSLIHDLLEESKRSKFIDDYSLVVASHGNFLQIQIVKNNIFWRSSWTTYVVYNNTSHIIRLLKKQCLNKLSSKLFCLFYV